ncbi:MAG: RHS repeat-associated core domain-containing protein, partial [Lachnospiraceae bacterium]|nr:RHS repeat-associated core domain-containing protein [Lachnospiraceae bacterium]
YDGSTFTWSNGRQLTGITNSGTGTNISYQYYTDGRRLQKTVGSVTTRYNWVGDKLFSTYQNDGTTFEFLYDESGNARGFWYKQGSGSWNLYFYVTNLQGDVTGIINDSGTVVGSYVYDAWGKATSITGTIAQANPIRYRGYYFDEETGFYYLRSRYYDPEICRFVNADSYASTGQDFIGYNMFAYCMNSPIENKDYAGMYAFNSIWSLKNDWAGRAILWHWLTGNGEDFIADNEKWDKYMNDNEILTEKILILVKSVAVSLQYGECVILDLTTNCEIENGESIIGYQYLHGTNADVGGLQITGYIKRHYNDIIEYDLRCTWNDMIDPNFKYSSDKAKSDFAHSIPFVNPTDYYIAVKWNVNGSYHLGGIGCGSRTIVAMTK